MSFLRNNLEPAAAAAPSLTAGVAEVEEACRWVGVEPKAVSASRTAVTVSIDEGVQLGEQVLDRLGIKVWRVNRAPTLTSVIGQRAGGRVIVYTARAES